MRPHLGTTLRIGVASCAMLLLCIPYGQHNASAQSADAIHVNRARPNAFDLVSSVKISDEVTQKAIHAARTAYNGVLSPYAKVTPEQARNAALASSKGAIVQDVVLQVIHQNLVYIALLEKEQTRHIVWVDAGNGKVLAMREMPKHHPARRPLVW